MRILFGMVLCLVLLVLAGVTYLFSGAYDVAADSGHSAIVDWAAKTTREHSVESRAEAITAPDHFSDDQIRRGAAMYTETCVTCHGGPGVAPTDIGKGLTPSPPDLAKHAGDLKPAKVFWVVKHGIRMTGMPSFGASHADDRIWDVVGFVTRRLPNLSAAAFHQIAERPGEGSLSR